MKNKSRRIFLRNTSLATTGVLLISPLAATKKYSGSRQSIGCAPGSFNSLTGTISTVQSGKWSDPSTWGGKIPAANDTPVISTGHIVDFDLNTTVSGININSGGVLQFDTSRSAELRSTQNIVVQGKLVMKPSSPAVVQTIRFVGINESNFVGGGHNVLNSDIGLWVMGAGQLDLAGARKKGWTRTTGSVSQGSLNFTVQDSNGWAVGDNIVLVPTDMPGANTFDWDNKLNVPLDTFAEKFERRTITAINGNTVTVNLPFLFNHNQVSTDSGKTWTPEVANLSRNVRIEGTATGRAHIFIRSTMPQNIYYMSGRYLGPRKVAGLKRPQLVTGRYGIHFHHCQDGSKGSMVIGCAIFDTGNRAYVPHMSHGVTMNHNVAFNCMEASFWWDFQELSHYTTWDGNLTALVSLNGIDGACRGMEMNMGDGNIAKNNVVVYGHNGDVNSQGAYAWNADSEGVWIFENNLSHSNRSGLFVWQNTSLNHTIIGQESYNDHLGVFHGAYINSYTYSNCYFYNALVRVKATAGNSSGVRFENTVFDGDNKRPYVTEIYPSPITSGADYNAFRECTFKNYSETAVRINTFPIANENTRKHVSLIKCNFSGKMVDFTKQSAYDSKVFIQPTSGQSVVISQAGTSAIASFAPYLYGSGSGLTGEYFNGSNFQDLAFSRVDSMIMFQQWTYDKAASPTQVHHLIKGDNYSMRWTGMIEAQYSETYKFKLQGSGGFRLWIDNAQIIDSWVDRLDNQDSVTSAGINLVAGQKYSIRIEHMNIGGARGCQLFWECPSLGRSIHVPQSQLYPVGIVPPITASPRRSIANAGADTTITLPVNKVLLDGSASSAGVIKAYEWKQVSGPNQANFTNKNAAVTEAKDLAEGIYLFSLQITDGAGNTAKDEVIVTVNPAAKNSNPQALVANAGTDITLTLPANVALLDASASSPAASIKTYEWTRVSGPGLANIINTNASSTEVKNLAKGIHLFKLQITDNAGNKATDEIMVTVSPAATNTNQQGKLVANAGSDIILTLPTNVAVLDASASTPAGSIKSYEWTKISGPGFAIIVSKNASTTRIKDLVEGTYVYSLKITDNADKTATDEIVVTVKPAAVNKTTNTSPPVANAGSDITMTLPTNAAQLDASASSSAVGLKSYEWTKKRGPNRISMGNSKSVSFKVSDLVEGIYVFNLRVTDNNGLVADDEIIVTVKPQPPVAHAGSDITINLPVSSVVLNGSASFAPLGIKTYEWTKISGPANYKIVNKNAISPVIQNLEIGTYVFQLQITDKNGITAVDEVTVRVNQGAGTNQQNNNNGKTMYLDLTASPNPSISNTDVILELRSNGELPITIKIYNRFGNLVASYPNLRYNSTVRWGANSGQGIYYAKAEQGQLTKTVKLIKL